MCLICIFVMDFLCVIISVCHNLQSMFCKWDSYICLMIQFSNYHVKSLIGGGTECYFAWGCHLGKLRMWDNAIFIQLYLKNYFKSFFKSVEFGKNVSIKCKHVLKYLTKYLLNKKFYNTYIHCVMALKNKSLCFWLNIK